MPCIKEIPRIIIIIIIIIIIVAVVERVEFYQRVEIEVFKGIGAIYFQILKFTMDFQTFIGNPRLLPLLQPYASTFFCRAVLWRVVSCCMKLSHYRSGQALRAP